MVIKHKFIAVFLAVTLMCWVGVSLWSAFSGYQGSSVDPDFNNVFSAMSMDYGTDYEIENTQLPVDALKTDGIYLYSSGKDYGNNIISVCNDISKSWKGSLILIISVADGLENEISSSYNDWQTGSGFVTVNGNAVGHLEMLGAAINDNDVIKADNLTSFMAYYSKYFGSKNAVPLVIDSAADPIRIKSFFTALADCNDGYKVLFLNDGSPGQEVFASSCIGLLLQYSGNTLLGRDDRGNLYFGRE